MNLQYKTTTLSVYLLSVSLLLVVASCSNCKNSTIKNEAHKENEEKQDTPPPQVMLSSNTPRLIGFQRFQVFLHNNTVTPANLSEYTLRINLQEEGSTGNKLEYQGADQQAHIESPIEQLLSHFTQQTTLEKDNSPLAIHFELVTTPGATKITMQVSLEHADKNIHMDPITIVWKDLKIEFGATEEELKALEEIKLKKKALEEFFRDQKDPPPAVIQVKRSK